MSTRSGDHTVGYGVIGAGGLDGRMTVHLALMTAAMSYVRIVLTGTTWAVGRIGLPLRCEPTVKIFYLKFVAALVQTLYGSSWSSCMDGMNHNTLLGIPPLVSPGLLPYSILKFLGMSLVDKLG